MLFKSQNLGDFQTWKQKKKVFYQDTNGPKTF